LGRLDVFGVYLNHGCRSLRKATMQPLVSAIFPKRQVHTLAAGELNDATDEDDLLNLATCDTHGSTNSPEAAEYDRDLVKPHGLRDLRLDTFTF
jgi:hypothetical protein